jgi:hypothetical protein
MGATINKGGYDDSKKGGATTIKGRSATISKGGYDI